MVIHITCTTGAYAVHFSMGELSAFYINFNFFCSKTKTQDNDRKKINDLSLNMLTSRQSPEGPTHLYQTLSGQSPCGSSGCPYGPSLCLRGSAVELAASAGVFAPSPRSPAGADFSGPPLQVSKKSRVCKPTDKPSAKQLVLP